MWINARSSNGQRLVLAAFYESCRANENRARGLTVQHIACANSVIRIALSDFKALASEKRTMLFLDYCFPILVRQVRRVAEQL